MTAETLRRAAAMIRDDWPDDADPQHLELAGYWLSSQQRRYIADMKFHRAVADWLTEVAVMCDSFEIDETEDPAALAVARAYLGESP